MTSVSQGWNLAKETVPRPKFSPDEAAALGRYRFYLAVISFISDMIKIALLAAAAAAVASAAREGKMMAVSEPRDRFNTDYIITTVLSI